MTNKIHSKKDNILILQPRLENTNKINDYASFNASKISEYFLSGIIYYFYDKCINFGVSYVHNEIKNIILKNNISIIFFMPFGSSFELHPFFFNDLKKYKELKLVLFVLDDELIFDVYSKYYAQVADAAITCDYYSVFQYEKLGVPALYYFSSYSKKEFYHEDLKKEYDVSFVGDCSKSDRMEYIDFIKKNGIKIETFGKKSENGFIEKSEIREIFLKSKINLNFTKTDIYSFSNAHNVWFNDDNILSQNIRQNKGRPMEIGMTRSFCLTEYSPSIKYTFEPGKEIEVFYNKNDLLNKIKFYLQNEHERNKIAENMYLKANNMYAAEIFIPKLLDSLITLINNQTPLKSSQIYIDKNFKIKTVSQYFYIFFIQLILIKFRSALKTARHLNKFGVLILFFGFLKSIKRISSKFLFKFVK
ncbi:glycosyltransferase [Candidatus Dependentiae bacterium]|nr:glycosyltransferase [Candidatus Dependentiae bacterium]